MHRGRRYYSTVYMIGLGENKEGLTNRGDNDLSFLIVLTSCDKILQTDCAWYLNDKFHQYKPPEFSRRRAL